jgi:Fe-S-cluster containining protein
MRVDCEGCAGCCLDWRPIAPAASDHERRGPERPLDDVYNLVPLTRDEVAAFVEAGLGDAMTPRMWAAAGDERGRRVELDGVEVAAVDGRPAFFVGLRKPPKPVGPFGTDERWLRSCVFLDPETLQCRIHGGDLYPDECAAYPGHNLVLDRETECERVEASFGGDRLLDATAPEEHRGLLLGPQALGAKVFAHPEPDRLDGVVDRMRRGALTDEDRADFVGVAVGSHPGSTEVDDARAATARERVLAAESWVGAAIEAWETAADEAGSPAGDAVDGDAVEVARGAPETPGWDDIDGGAEGVDGGEKD